MKKILFVVLALFLASNLSFCEEVQSSNVEYPEYQPLKPQTILYDGNNLGGVRTRNNETNFKGGAYREETNGVQMENTNYVEKDNSFRKVDDGVMIIRDKKYKNVIIDNENSNIDKDINKDIETDKDIKDTNKGINQELNQDINKKNINQN